MKNKLLNSILGIFNINYYEIEESCPELIQEALEVIEEYSNQDDIDMAEIKLNEEPEEKLVGTLTKAFGIGGHDTAQIGHPVYENHDRYIIYLAPTNHRVTFYKDTFKSLKRNG